MRKMAMFLWIWLVVVAGKVAAESEQQDSTITEAGLTDEVRKAEEPEAEKQKSGAFRFYWEDGLHFDAPADPFKLRIGGRVHIDAAVMHSEDELEGVVGELDDDVGVRRAWLELYGYSVFKRLHYKVQLGFSGGDIAVGDIYLDLLNLRWLGNMRFGVFREPFGLEENTSNNNTTFMERSLTDAFAPSGSAGIMIHDGLLDERMTLAFGVFRGVNDLESDDEKRAYDLTLRLTALPWYADEGRNLLHLGASYSQRFPTNDEVQFRQRPEVYLAPRFVDTGLFAADTYNQVGIEAALVRGATSLQGELMHVSVSTPEGTDPQFYALYLMASHFLTGESRPYRSSTGAFGRVQPNRRFSKDGGIGAWEVAVRYSHIDLNDAGIQGGKLDDVALGLNWYLNPNARVMWNYVHSWLDSVGDADMFQMRLQVNF